MPIKAPKPYTVVFQWTIDLDNGLTLLVLKKVLRKLLDSHKETSDEYYQIVTFCSQNAASSGCHVFVPFT